MGKFNIKKIFLFKCLICTVFSGLIYLSFRIDLIYKNDVNILISFIIIQFIIWSILFFSKRKFISNISYSLFICLGGRIYVKYVSIETGTNPDSFVDSGVPTNYKQITVKVGIPGTTDSTQLDAIKAAKVNQGYRLVFVPYGS